MVSCVWPSMHHQQQRLNWFPQSWLHQWLGLGRLSIACPLSNRHRRLICVSDMLQVQPLHRLYGLQSSTYCTKDFHVVNRCSSVGVNSFTMSSLTDDLDIISRSCINGLKSLNVLLKKSMNCGASANTGRFTFRCARFTPLKNMKFESWVFEYDCVHESSQWTSNLIWSITLGTFDNRAHNLRQQPYS